MQFYFIKLTKHYDYGSQKCQLLKLLTIMKIFEPISLYPSRRHCDIHIAYVGEKV